MVFLEGIVPEVCLRDPVNLVTARQYAKRELLPSLA